MPFIRQQEVNGRSSASSGNMWQHISLKQRCRWTDGVTCISPNPLSTLNSDGYPTLACHLDQVQALHSEDFEVKQDGDMLYGWSEQNQQREGLGADDKNGIFVCLRCLEECPQLKVFMAVGEEKGCIGSNHADMSFFADSLYVLEPDCKGGKEIHVNLRGIPCASDDFIAALEAEANDYTITDGKTSDIFVLTINHVGGKLCQHPSRIP